MTLLSDEQPYNSLTQRSVSRSEPNFAKVPLADLRYSFMDDDFELISVVRRFSSHFLFVLPIKGIPWNLYLPVERAVRITKF